MEARVMTWYEWLTAAIGYVIAGCGFFVLTVGHRYDVRLSKHIDRRCIDDCYCRRWRHLSDGDDKMRKLARQDAETSTGFMAVVWPVASLLYLLKGIAFVLVITFGFLIANPISMLTDRAISKRDKERQRERST
jgi:hypothetical protein